MSLLAVTPIEFLAYGTFWFWALLALEVVFLFIFVSTERGFLATISVVGYLLILQFLVGVDLFSYVAANPVAFLSGVILYFMIGTVWGIVKWYLYLLDKLEDYEEAKVDWLSRRNVTGTVVPENLKADWAYHIKNTILTDYGAIVKPPLARNNKARIMHWMAFWVVSMLWSLVDDFVRRIFNRIYNSIAAFLQRMSDKVFASVKNDFPDPE